MGADELPEKIEALVDHLRGNRDEAFSLADVASVTEVLIGTMRTYFRSIDTKIYDECRQLSDYIGNARKEIAALQPADLETARIPRAGMELDAIVQQTEEATNTIMESAEAIMGADPADVALFQETVQNNIMQIFEACSFQDITGQRISKVVQALSYVEERIYELRSLLGITDDYISQTADINIGDDDSLLHGPSLAGEGIDQDEVDALMDGNNATAKGSASSAKKTTGKVAKASKADQTPKKDSPISSAKPGSKKPDIEKADDSLPQSSNQDEIDALFS